MLYVLFRMQIAYKSILKYERGLLVSTQQSFVEKKCESFTLNFMFKGTLFFSVSIETFFGKGKNIVYTNIRISVSMK